jgi:hypothetical protein
MDDPHAARPAARRVPAGSRARRRAALRAASGAGLGLCVGALARAVAPLRTMGGLLGGVLGGVLGGMLGGAAQHAGAAAGPGAELGTSGEGEETLAVPGAALRLEFLEGFDAGLRAATRDALRSSALAVAAYFGGRFPVPAARVRLVAIEGHGVHAGRTYNEPDLNISLHVGVSTSAAEFRADWVMVHEMLHLAIPDVPRAQLWFHEGIATYAEGVARGHAGLEAPLEVWHEWRVGMPKGLPAADDRGLDRTPTWGRTYWGGALFCLLADIRIRERSALKLGLGQALQGVIAAGGSYAVAWPLARTLAVADAAIGQDTLAELHAAWAETPVRVDLPALWASLGVGDAFDDAAPRAAVRRAILS